MKASAIKNRFILTNEQLKISKRNVLLKTGNLNHNLDDVVLDRYIFKKVSIVTSSKAKMG